MAVKNQKTSSTTSKLSDAFLTKAGTAPPHRQPPPDSELPIRCPGAIRGEVVVANLPPEVLDLAELLADIAHRDLRAPNNQ